MASVAEVVEQRGPDLVGERQPERAACLALRDAQPPRPPLHVVERERHDLACAQAVGRHEEEEEDRVVATPHRGRAIDRVQQRPNRVPGSARGSCSPRYTRGVSIWASSPVGISPAAARNRRKARR